MLLLFLVASCVGNPDPYDKGLLPSTQRVLALDFGRQVTAQRLQQLRRLPKATGAEIGRASHVLGLDGSNPIRRIKDQEIRRTSGLTDRTLMMFGSELRRRPHELGRMLPSSHQFSRNTANNLDTALRFFGIGKQPLREINDAEHRTDHRDMRPEATWWQRIRRRLPI